MPDDTFDIANLEKTLEELYAETGGLSIEKARILPVISPGIFIKTQVLNSYRWNVSTILNINWDILTLPFTRDDAYSNILTDDIIRFRFGVGRYDLNFLCNLRNIEFDSAIPIKHIKVLKAEIWKNKRGSTRHNAGFICRTVSEIDENFLSYLINISDLGCGIICKENLRIGSNIKLSFLGQNKMPLNLIATVVRSKKLHDNKVEYGIRFFNLSPGVNQKIQEIIDMERSQENDLFQEICKEYNIKPFFK